MSHPTASRPARKPRKPSRDFPLFVHQTGRWAKKVRQRFVYFGRVADDPGGEAALKLWLDQKDDLLAGRKPRPASDGDGLRVRDLLNRFLTTKKRLLDSREIAPRTYDDYYRTCARLTEAFGRTRRVDDLRGEDFEQLRAALAAKWGPVALGNEVQRVRTIFHYAYEENLIDKPVRFGQSFKRPSKKTLRKDRQSKGPKLFGADEIHAMLRVASVPLRAMILLAVNGGLGNADCGMLTKSALDLDGGWLNYPRPKTGVPRRIPLWDETVAALRQALAERPAPKEPANEDLVFVTRWGESWAKTMKAPTAEDGTPAKSLSDQPISKEMVKLLAGIVRLTLRDGKGREHTYVVTRRDKLTADGKPVEVGALEPGRAVELRLQGQKGTHRGTFVGACSLRKKGLGFYGLRHTFRTIADEAKDSPSADALMGHESPHMSSVYRERISDERLRAVTEHVRQWLFADGRA